MSAIMSPQLPIIDTFDFPTLLECAFKDHMGGSEYAVLDEKFQPDSLPSPSSPISPLSPLSPVSPLTPISPDSPVFGSGFLFETATSNTTTNTSDSAETTSGSASTATNSTAQITGTEFSEPALDLSSIFDELASSDLLSNATGDVNLSGGLGITHQSKTDWRSVVHPTDLAFSMSLLDPTMNNSFAMPALKAQRMELLESQQDGKSLLSWTAASAPVTLAPAPPSLLTPQSCTPQTHFTAPAAAPPPPLAPQLPLILPKHPQHHHHHQHICTHSMFNNISLRANPALASAFSHQSYHFLPTPTSTPAAPLRLQIPPQQRPMLKMKTDMLHQARQQPYPNPATKPTPIAPAASTSSAKPQPTTANRKTKTASGTAKKTTRKRSTTSTAPVNVGNGQPINHIFVFENFEAPPSSGSKSASTNKSSPKTKPATAPSSATSQTKPASSTTTSPSTPTPAPVSTTSTPLPTTLLAHNALTFPLQAPTTIPTLDGMMSSTNIMAPSSFGGLPPSSVDLDAFILPNLLM
ncbi:hypothetical protein HK102_002789 [Quaeritorhiza haematococci]|nr:hypothetical protein HK102_002789 [Quaeritorhiza haematococci]